MGLEWAMTLFHYRNRAANYGRVLIATRQQTTLCREDALPYPYEDVTANPAYKLFLH